jgi:CubicO group peptidase (beta-lactamase class C family)
MKFLQRCLRTALLGLALSGAVLASAQPLPAARPEQVGLSAERLQMLSEVFKADVAAGKIPGAVLQVARRGKLAWFEPIGSLDPVAGTSMTRDGIFRIYSMSKPVTTVAAMMLVEDGRMKLDDPISMYLPEYARMTVGVEKPGTDGKPVLDTVPARRPITVQDLMRHTSGLTYGFFGPGLVKQAYNAAGLGAGDPTNAEFSERLARLPLAYQPGTTWDYSHSTDILGRLVEVVSGQSLFQFEKARLFDPLGMKDTSYYVPERARQQRIAEPLPIDRSFGVGAELNDPRMVRKLESGGGGLVSTAGDYACFLQMLLDGGTFEGKRYLGPHTLTLMTSDHSSAGAGIVPGPLYLPGPGYGFGLGFAVRRNDGEAPYPSAGGEYNWGGAGGTYMWVDPKNELFVVLMLQSPKHRVHYRSLTRNMVYAAILKQSRPE